jgi:hypothetical protein
MNPTDYHKIILPLKRFLLIDQCPADWKPMDLYLIRDEEVVFYVGQSYLAFARVWEHLIGGFKGHSIVGRFIWNNWPASMKFTIELMSSQYEPLDVAANDLNAAERVLIERWSPCFNVSLNSLPEQVPAPYLPVNAKIPVRKSLNKLIHEAERALQSDEKRRWMQELE